MHKNRFYNKDKLVYNTKQISLMEIYVFNK